MLSSLIKNSLQMPTFSVPNDIPHFNDFSNTFRLNCLKICYFALQISYDNILMSYERSVESSIPANQIIELVAKSK